MHFFCTLKTVSLPAAGRSSCCRLQGSRCRLRGTQGGRVYTRCKFGPRPGAVARALGVQKSRDMASNHGTDFRRAIASQDSENPTI